MNLKSELSHIIKNIGSTWFVLSLITKLDISLIKLLSKINNTITLHTHIIYIEIDR